MDPGYPGKKAVKTPITTTIKFIAGNLQLTTKSYYICNKTYNNSYCTAVVELISIKTCMHNIMHVVVSCSQSQHACYVINVQISKFVNVNKEHGTFRLKWYYFTWTWSHARQDIMWSIAIPFRLTFCGPVFTVRCYASAICAVIVCPPVRMCQLQQLTLFKIWLGKFWKYQDATCDVLLDIVENTV